MEKLFFFSSFYEEKKIPEGSEFEITQAKHYSVKLHSRLSYLIEDEGPAGEISLIKTLFSTLFSIAD